VPGNQIAITLRVDDLGSVVVTGFVRGKKQELDALQAASAKTGAALAGVGHKARGMGADVNHAGFDIQRFTRDMVLMRSMAVAATVQAAKFPVALFAATAGVVAFTVAVAKTVVEAAKLESQIANVMTLLREADTRALGGVTAATERYTREVRSLSVEFGKSTEDLSKGLFEIVSAAIEPAKALDVLRSASQAAVAGNTDLATSTRGILTVLNAYQLGAEKAADAADFLFALNLRGVTTFAQISNAIGTVATLAFSTGVRLEELGAFLSTVTRAGISMDEAVTQLRQVLVTFLSPAKGSVEAAKELGIELNTTTIKTLGLLGVAKLLSKATEEQTAAIFGNVRALGGIIVAAKNAEGFQEDLRLQMQRTGSTTEALTTIQNTAKFQWDRLKESIVAVASTLGTPLLGAMASVAKAGADALKEIVKIGDEKQRILELASSFDKLKASMPGTAEEQAIDKIASNLLRALRAQQDFLQLRANAPGGTIGLNQLLRPEVEMQFLGAGRERTQEEVLQGMTAALATARDAQGRLMRELPTEQQSQAFRDLFKAAEERAQLIKDVKELTEAFKDLNDVFQDGILSAEAYANIALKQDEERARSLAESLKLLQRDLDLLGITEKDLADAFAGANPTYAEQLKLWHELNDVWSIVQRQLKELADNQQEVTDVFAGAGVTYEENVRILKEMKDRQREAFESQHSNLQVAIQDLGDFNHTQAQTISLLSRLGGLLGDISSLFSAFGLRASGAIGSLQNVFGGLRAATNILGFLGRGQQAGGPQGTQVGDIGGGGFFSNLSNLFGAGRLASSVAGFFAPSSAIIGAGPFAGLTAGAATTAGASIVEMGAIGGVGPAAGIGLSTALPIIGAVVGAGLLAFSIFGKSGRAKELERQAKLLEESFAGLRSTLQGVNAGLAALAEGPLGRGAAGSLASGLANLPAAIERFSGVTRNRLRLFGPTRELAGNVAEGVLSLLGGEAGVRNVARSGAFPESFFTGLVNRRFELPVGPEGIFSDAQLGKRGDIQRAMFLSRLAGAGFEISGATPFGREETAHGLTAESIGAGTVVVQGLEQIAELFRVFSSPGDLERVRAFNEEFAEFLEGLQAATEGFKQRTFERAQGFAGVIETVSAALFQLRPPTAQAQIKAAMESFAAFSRVLAEGGAGAGPEGLQNIFEGLTEAATRFASVLEDLRQENIAASRAIEDLTLQQRLSRASIEEQAFEASLRGMLPEDARAARLARLQARRADIAARLAAPDLMPETALGLVGEGRDVLQRLLELQSQNADLTIDEFALGRNQMVAELEGLAGISDMAFQAQIEAQQGILDANQDILDELGIGGSIVGAQQAAATLLEGKLEDIRAIAAGSFNSLADLLRAIDTNTDRLAKLGLIETKLGDLNTLWARRREPPTAAEIAQAARLEVPDFPQLDIAVGALLGFPAALSGVLRDFVDQNRLPSPQSLAVAQGGLSTRDAAIWEQIQNEARALLAQGAGADVISSFIRVRQQSLGFGGIPSFQVGGVMPRTGLAFLHAGETVTPSANGSRPAPINVEINDRQTIQLVTGDGRVIAEVVWPHVKRLIIEAGRRGELFVRDDSRLDGS